MFIIDSRKKQQSNCFTSNISQELLDNSQYLNDYWFLIFDHMQYDSSWSGYIIY